MLITGYKQRSLAQRDSLSFQGLFTFPHITGSSEFGFVGNNTLAFNFSGGRLYDPEGNYTYDYLANKPLLISGNISPESYNYYIDGEYVAFYPNVPTLYSGVCYSRNSRIATGVSLSELSTDHRIPVVVDSATVGGENSSLYKIKVAVSGFTETNPHVSGHSEFCDPSYVYRDGYPFSLDNSSDLWYLTIENPSQRIDLNFSSGYLSCNSYSYEFQFLAYGGSQVTLTSDWINGGSSSLGHGTVTPTEIEYALSSDGFFYFDTTLPFDVDLRIMANPQEVEYVYPSDFNTGESFSFDILNLTSGYNFKIFSGELKLNNSFTNTFAFNGSSFPQEIATTGLIEIQDFGAQCGVSYPFNFTLYTNQGNLTGNFSIIDDLPSYYSTFNFINLNNSGYANFLYDSGDATDLTSRVSGLSKYGNYRLDYTIDTPSTEKALFIELSNSGGNTGSYLAPFVTGINPLTLGSGYSSAPTISFDGDGAGAAATISLAGGALDFSTISFTSFGEGYTYAPNISFDGGSPTISGAGTACLSGYTKTFFNTWTLYTGLDSTTLVPFDTQTGINRYYSNTPLSYLDNSLYIVVKARNWWDTDLSYAQLTVSGLDNNISVAIITGGIVTGV